MGYFPFGYLTPFLNHALELDLVRKNTGFDISVFFLFYHIIILYWTIRLSPLRFENNVHFSFPPLISRKKKSGEEKNVVILWNCCDSVSDHFKSPRM